MNAPQQPTPLEVYRAQVLPPEKASDLFKSLPAHIKPSTFERNLLNALMANPDLMNFHPSLVYREVAKAAGLGLLLDPLLGEAYIVVAYNYKSKRKEPQLRVGYKGMIKLARQTGNMSTISCHEVYSLDEVDVDLGFPKVFHHRPKLFADRGAVVGYVAIIAFKDGTFDFEPMSVEQCQAIRNRSDAWKAFSEGLIKSTPWATDESEMSKKTTLRRLLKRQEQSPETARANQIEDEAEFESHTRPALIDDGGGPPAPAMIYANDEGGGPPAPSEEATGTEAVDDGGGPPAPEAVVETGPVTVNEHEDATADDFPGDKPMAPAADDLDIPDYLRRSTDKPPQTDDERDWIESLENAFSGCEDLTSLADEQERLMSPNQHKVSTDVWNSACDLLDEHVQRMQTGG